MNLHFSSKTNLETTPHLNSNNSIKNSETGGSVFTEAVASSTASTPNANLKPGDPLPVNAFIELAKAVNPAVVNISTSVMPKRGKRYRDPFFDMLEQHFGISPMIPQNVKPATALGTGFIMREDGLIITNNHVISGADEIKVQLSENSEKLLEAKLIGSDERTDIALIKISGNGYPIAKLGSSKTTEVGEWVAAFGNPFGNGHTMTKGIVSAKGRDISEINRLPLIQTDAPINPGNSGGPLVNLRGEVIGVNSAIDARAQGIGFAIPIDDVKQLLPQLEKTGKIKKGYLGLALEQFTPMHAAELGIEEKEGAFVMNIENKGPADKAGFKPYDLVVEFEGKKVRGPQDLSDQIAGTSIDKEVKIKVIRDGKPKFLTAKIGERPDGKFVANRPGSKSVGVNAPHELGFTFADANPQLRKEFSVPEDIDKPIITQVVERSKAAEAGLLAGDVIIDVNRKEVSSSASAMKQFRKGTNTMRIFRDGVVLLVFIKTN